MKPIAITDDYKFYHDHEEIKSKNENSSNTSHIQLNFQSKRAGVGSKHCIPYKYLANDIYFNSMQLDNSCKWKTLGPSKLIKTLFNDPDSELKEINPESLNDNDFDMLLDDEPVSSLGNIKEEEHAVADPNEAVDMEPDFIYTHLIVGENSIHFSGSPNVTMFKHGINDCKVLNPSSDRFDDLILIVQSSGLLISVLPSKENYSNIYSSTDAKSRVVQYWTLGYHDNWKIITHSSGKEFSLVGSKTKMIKFFKFENHYKFTLVNNLVLDEYSIQTCMFFENIVENKNKSIPFLLFVPTIRSGRITYLCIEWDSTTELRKQVHQLPYLKGTLINGVIPLGSNNALLFSSNLIYMVSANQIMSGEVSFTSSNLTRELRGMKSWFIAPILLNKLKQINEDEFNRYSDCNIISTTTGMIYICLTNDECIEFYPLTRFKGVKTVCPQISDKLLLTDTVQYQFIIISFNRTLAISVDLSSIIKKKTSSPFQNIISKRTLDIGSDVSTDVNIIKNSIWQFSNSSISQISNGNSKELVVPFMKLRDVVEHLNSFDIYNSIKSVKVPDNNEWEEFLGIEESSSNTLLVCGNSEQILDIYLIIEKNADTENFKQEDSGIQNIDVIQLNDIITIKDERLKSFKPLYFTLYEEYIVYVDSGLVWMESIKTGEINEFSSEVTIENFQFQDGIMIIWNDTELKAWSCIDITKPIDGKIQFNENHCFQNVLTSYNFSNVNFDIDKCDEGTVILSTYNGIYTSKFRNFFGPQHEINVTDNRHISFRKTALKDLIVLDEYYIYIAENSIIQCIQKSKIKEESIKVPEFPFQGKDIQLRKYNNDTVFIFSNNEVYAMQIIKDKTKPFIWQLRTPFKGKLNPIIDLIVQDVNYNNKNPKIFILFGTGLSILECSYYTWIYNNYLLKYTRSKNKKFIFLSKINRLLVINYDYKDWYCMKLENGKVLTLDNDVIENEKDKNLINVVEIPSLNERDITLILNFETMIKYVKIIPENNKIHMQEICKINFSSRILEKISINDDNSFYVLQINDSAANNINATNYFDKFIHIVIDKEVNDMTISNELEYNGKGETKTFEVCNNKNIVLSNTKCDKLFVYQHIDEHFDPNSISRLTMPSDSLINKIIVLENDCIAVACRLEGRSRVISVICLYALQSIPHTVDLDENQPYGAGQRTGISAFDQRSTEHTQSNNRNIEIPYSRSDYIYLDVQPDANDPPRDKNSLSANVSYITPGTQYESFQGSPSNPSSKYFDEPEMPYNLETYMKLETNDPVTEDKSNKPYRVIGLDKTIKDINYNKESKRLVVLLNDDSVLDFKDTATLLKQEEWLNAKLAAENSGYSIPLDKDLHLAPTNIPLSFIDQYGRTEK